MKPIIDIYSVLLYEFQ